MQERTHWLAALAVTALGLGCTATPMAPGDPDSSGGGGGTGQTTNPAAVVSTNGGATGATTATGGSSGSVGGVACNAPPVAWQTGTVSLKADAFWIVADGQCYTSRGLPVQVHSDPGWSQYTSLELVWTELGREMRFFIYLYANPASWWSDEMRTYDGQMPYSDWLFYYGEFFTSPIGQAWSGDLDLVNDAQDQIRGELHLRGLTLSTTMTGK